MTQNNLEWYEPILNQPTQPNTNSVVWGLTGGIGSGKSTVASLLIERGIPVIDTDTIAILSREAKRAEIEAAFETSDKFSLSEIVFKSPEKLKQLEAILLPHLQESLLKLLSHITAPLIFVESALFSKKFLLEPIKEGHVVNVMVADQENRINRVMARNGFSREHIINIIANQPTDFDRMGVSAYFIINHDKDDLARQVDVLIQRILGD